MTEREAYNKLSNALTIAAINKENTYILYYLYIYINYDDAFPHKH